MKMSMKNMNIRNSLITSMKLMRIILSVKKIITSRKMMTGTRRIVQKTIIPVSNHISMYWQLPQ